MQEIREIIGVLGRSEGELLKEIELVLASRGREVLIFSLFCDVRDGVYRTDDEAARGLYERDGSYPAYQTLKSRLRSLLLDYLFRVKPDEGMAGEFTRCEHEARSLAHQGFVLVRADARSTGVKILKKALKIAQKYQITDVELFCLNLLREDAIAQGDMKLFRSYDIIEPIYRKRCEDSATVCYGEMVLGMDWRDREERLSDDPAYREIIEFDGDSRLVQYYRYNEYILERQRQRNHREVSNLCSLAIAYYRQHSHFQTNATMTFLYLSQATAQFHLWQSADALTSISEAEKYVRPGSRNYHTVQILKALCLLHTGKTLEFAEVCRGVVTTLLSSKNPGDYSDEEQIWAVLWGYASWLMPELFGVDPVFDEPGVTTSGQKEGAGAAWLVLAILQLATANRGGHTGDHTDNCQEYLRNIIGTIENYMKRYLREPECSRTRAFLRLVVIWIRQGFCILSTTRKAAKYILLIESRSAPADNLEVLPYDWCWKKIVDCYTE